MRKIICTFLYFFTFIQVVNAQYYKEHYIAPAPWQYWSTANEIVIGTLSPTPVDVELRKSDGTLLTFLTVSAGNPISYRFEGTASALTSNQINQNYTDRGLFVEAEEPVLVNMRNIASDASLLTASTIKGNASLVSFGNEGLGTEFRLGYYRQSTLGLYSGNVVYSVMATVDETTVVLPTAPTPTTIVLQKGMSRLFYAPIGSLLTADKPVVMNVGSWGDTPQTCGSNGEDGTFDQIAPVNVLGMRYLVVRGNGTAPTSSQANLFYGSEQSIIVAAEDNTKVTIQHYNASGGIVGAPIVQNLMAAGSFYSFYHGDGQNQFSSSLIESNKPVIVYSGTAVDCETDISTVLPIGGCSGSTHIETRKFIGYDNNNLPYFGFTIIESATEPVMLGNDNIETLTGNMRVPLGTSGFYMLTFNNVQINNPNEIVLYSDMPLTTSLVQQGVGFSMSAFFSAFGRSLSLGQDLVIEGSNALCPGDTFLIDSKLDPELYTFQWTRDGVDIVGANGPSYLVTESGLYGLKLGNKGTGDCVINPLPIKIEYFDSIILERELEDLIKCTGEGQGLIFNLQEAVEGLTFSPVVYEFYNSFTDAEAQTGALGDFYHMSSNASTKTVWVRIQSIDGNPCYKIMSFTLRKEICEVEIVHLNDLEVCANGAASFDLTVYNDIVYHGLPGYNVSYHTSEADAIGAANAIPAGDLTAYPGTHNEVIWVRVTKADDPTVYQYTSFKLLIRPVPVINPNLTALYACVEEGAGTGDFNLGSKDNEIKQSASGLIVEYYASEVAAEEGDPANKLSSSSYISGAGTVYIRLYSPLTGCYSVGELELKLGNIPSLSGESEVQVCDNSGYYNFNLTVIAADVIGVGTLADVTYKFYTTYSDAQNKLNSLSGGYYTNTQPWSEVIYLRVEDKVSKCYVIQAIGLKVGEKPALGTASDLEACDSGTTGVANFDLTQRETEILNGLDAASYHIYYYSSMAQAQAGGTSGRINTPASYSNLTTNYVYVRVENKATGCYSIAQIKLVVHPRPVVSSNISDLKMCDGVENDGIAEFVLKTKALSIAAGNNDLVVSFHETQPDAENNANGLNQEGYLNITPHQQTIYIRVTDSTTGCYVIRTMKLIVNTYPVFTLDEEVVVCSSSNSSIGEFNLVAIGQSYTENYLNYNFRFYETYANAVGNIDHIIDPESYHNVAEGVTSVWVRIENIETGCIGIYAIALRVNKSPVVPANVPVLSVCDTYGNPHDGKAEVDLTLNSSIISQNMGSVPYQIIYYKNQANAENNQQAINEPDAYYNDLSTETIWFRLVNLETGCYTIGHFDLEIKEGVVLVRPADITVCSDLSLGTNKYLFDLTIRENEALGGEPIFGVTVSYYESEADAQSGSNAIEDPTAYINTSAVQTIWIVAYRNNGCSTMTTMNLRVYATPSPNYSPSALEVCETEFGLGEAEFNLEDSIGDIISGDTHLEVSFYETAADAQSGDNEISAADRVEYVSESTLVYVRVENSLTGTDPKCFVIVELPLQVNAKPYIEVSPFIICMDNHPEYYKFNLEDKNEEILDGRSSEDYQVTYYTSEAAANDADQPVAYTYVNADPESQLLWIRLENLHTGCFHVAELLLQIEEKVYAFAPDAVEAEHFSVCADLESGLGNFNFSVFTPAIIGEQNLTAGDLKVTYYASESDYQAGEAIAAPTSVNLPVGEHAIVAVVSRRQTGFYCQDEVRFTVRVYETPVAPVLTGATVCTNYDNNTLYEPYVIDTHYDASQYDFVWMHNGDIVGGNQAYYVVDTPAKLGSYQVEVRYKGEDCPNLSNEVTIKTIRAFDIRVRNQDSTGMVGSIENEERVDVVIESPVDIYEEDEDGNVIVDDQFEYAINEGEYQDSRTFYNVPNGEHTLWVRYKGERSICPQSKSIFILGYPKYFTPNGDGFNDVWNVPGLKGHPEAVIYIFDRYGKLLQQLSPSGEGWDGTFKGKAMPSTDYWFMVEYLQESVDGKTPPRKVEFKGHFSLKR